MQIYQLNQRDMNFAEGH